MACETGSPSIAAVRSLTSNGAWVLFQMLTRPSLFHWTVQLWSSMYP